MRLYNTLTRAEEEFAPSEDNVVRMYACGLTVYSRGHIGNFRTFVAVDVLRRTLRYLENYSVRQVMNFTDVDDRTIAGSQKVGMPLREYTNQWIDAFLEDARALGLEDVEERPRATDQDNLDAMAELVRSLKANGHTYESDGSVYFKISTLPQYGRLARLDHDGLKAGARVDSDNYDKDNARDFVLWKATKPDEPSWDFGFGRGRPGWHLECSAMALRLLGEPPIDIHCGGVDLDFSASRERDRAERRRDEHAVRTGLDARRASPHRRGEDVEVARQRLQSTRHRDQGLPPIDVAISAAVDALPQAGKVQLGRDEPGRRGPAAPGRLRRAARSCDRGGGAS